MKITLSKSQWQMIGQKTGWMKKFQDIQSPQPQTILPQTPMPQTPTPQSPQYPQLIGPPKAKPRLPPINPEDYATEEEYIKNRRPIELFVSNSIDCSDDEERCHSAYDGDGHRTIEVPCDESHYSYETIIMDYIEEYITGFEKNNSNRHMDIDQVKSKPEITKTNKGDYTQLVVQYEFAYEYCDGHVYLTFECDLPHDSW